MNIFAEEELSDFFENLIQNLKNEVLKEEKNHLLNYNETEYIQHLASKYTIEPIVIHTDKKTITDREELIPADRFPPGFNVFYGNSYPRQVITFYLPFSGDSRLLSLRPSHRMIWTREVKLRGNEIIFDVINFRDNPDEIKNIAEGIIGNIKQQAINVANEVERYNSSLEQKAREIVKSRKEEHLRQSNLLAKLGVALKTKKTIPETFTVPTVKVKTIITKPSTSSSPFTPEPTLDSTIYHKILKICFDTGVEMERHPSIFKEKDEETLRDHFIMVLASHFESVTGETFNKQGKTDILIRYEGKNLFVAECKYWNGQKEHTKAINQVLSYLTWRDSKAAIFYFIKNKQLDPVLQQITEFTPSHPSFVKFGGKSPDGWYNYHFHLLEDNTRGLELAVLCFHFPE